jgi:hypothetical protein
MRRDTTVIVCCSDINSSSVENDVADVAVKVCLIQLFNSPLYIIRATVPPADVDDCKTPLTKP